MTPSSTRCCPDCIPRPPAGEEGALAIRLQDLDTDRCLVKLLPLDQLLRFRNGHPLTSRRYDQLWNRLGDRLSWGARYLPWIITLNVSAHWIRYTTLTWVERNFSFATAHAYAGHFDEADTRNATLTYVKATVHDIVNALSALTGEPHPLAI